MGRYGLADWADIEPAVEWSALLAGNGASRAVSSSFDYSSLFDAAALNSADRALFEELRTRNFEEVLRSLQVATFVVEQTGQDPEPITRRHDAIRRALIETVRQHHVGWNDVQGTCLDRIKTALRSFEAVFTTSYDLLFYWAVNFGGASGFIDYFGNPPSFHFDPHNTSVPAGTTAMHWLHGGLQICRWQMDGTAKRRHNGAALLDQLADDEALPLYVAEGDTEQKRAAIRRSDYLTFCYESLRAETRDLVVLGQHLGLSDQHLVDALAEHPERIVAYGVHPSSQQGVDVTRATIAQRLQRDDVQFFDSTTHPLADPSLLVA